MLLLTPLLLLLEGVPGNSQSQSRGLFTRVAVADFSGSLIRVYRYDQTESSCLEQVALHSFPVK